MFKIILVSVDYFYLKKTLGRHSLGSQFKSARWSLVCIERICLYFDSSFRLTAEQLAELWPSTPGFSESTLLLWLHAWEQNVMCLPTHPRSFFPTGSDRQKLCVLRDQNTHQTGNLQSKGKGGQRCSANSTGWRWLSSYGVLFLLKLIILNSII